MNFSWWTDNTSDGYPDWIRVDFGGSKKGATSHDKRPNEIAANQFRDKVKYERKENEKSKKQEEKRLKQEEKQRRRAAQSNPQQSQ